jgi:hypothetical protein
MRKRSCWVLVAILLMPIGFEASSGSGGSDFVRWSRKDCAKIISSSSAPATQSVASAVVDSIGLTPKNGIKSGPRDGPSLQVIWLTDDAIKALARTRQLAVTGSTGEALTWYAELRAQIRDRYAFLVTVHRQPTPVLKTPPTPLDMIETKFDPEVILRNKKNPSRTSRVQEWLPKTSLPTIFPAIGALYESYVLCFDKTAAHGEALVRSIDDEMQLSIPVSGHGVYTATFKLHKFADSTGGL